MDNAETNGRLSDGELAKTLNDQLLRAWTLYISFFTIFMTVNFVAMGVTVENEDDISRLIQGVISIAFIVQNGISARTAFGMRSYSADVHAQLEELGHPQLGLLGPMTEWGGRGNGYGHYVIMVLWVAVAFV